MTDANGEYEYEYEHTGETIQVGVHCGGVAHEPRIRWQVGTRSGECGYVHLDAPEPVIQLEEGETARLQDKRVAAIPVPRPIAEDLDATCKRLGTISEDDQVGTDPSTFPTEIDDFERIGWEADRNVMWYWRDERSDPRAYQIEEGELVFRAQEWAEEVSSKQELIDQYELIQTF